MYKLIQRFLDILFGKDKLSEEYEKVLNSINRSNHLGELFNSRAGLIKFHEKVKERGSPEYLKQRVKFLSDRWDFKYRIWKAQSRG